MAAKQCKCKQCGRFFQPDMLVKISGENYCPDCAPARKIEAKANTSLNGLLIQLCDGDTSYLPRFRTEINKAKEDFNCKTTTILKLFQYVFTLEDPPEFQPELGIGWIIRRYYPQAKRYYDTIAYNKSHFDEEYLKEYMMKPVKEIHVKRSVIVQHDLDFYERQKDSTYGPEIDITNITENQEDR